MLISCPFLVSKHKHVDDSLGVVHRRRRRRFSPFTPTGPWCRPECRVDSRGNKKTGEDEEAGGVSAVPGPADRLHRYTVGTCMSVGSETRETDDNQW